MMMKCVSVNLSFRQSSESSNNVSKQFVAPEMHETH